jgi:signal peptidase I
MRKPLAWALGIIVLLALTLFVLDRTWLLVPIGPRGASEAPTIAACKGRTLAEGFTYKFRDPKRGELVAFRARGASGSTITPDPDGGSPIVERVVGVPDDQIEAHDGRVYVDGVKFDDIPTKSFAKVDLGHNEYFVLGDNRSYSQDSRDFGPVPRDAIFGKVFLVFWPLGDFGSPESHHPGPPPGQINCD